MEKTPKVACIALDFDETLAFINNPKTELFNTWEKRGVPKEIGEKAYEEIHDGEGFSYPGMKIVLKKYGYDMDEGFEKELWERLERGLQTFTEVKETIERWKKMIPVVIVTAGEESFQREKIKRTGLSDLPCIVTRVGNKTKALRTFIEKYGEPVAFIDDKISELETLKNAGFSEKELIPVLLDRTGKTKKSQFETISSLDDPKLSVILGF
ncbi:MAG: HAD family hydrolase [Candidatus Pacebacteria bacterium]|nr:HAD family hydrolase [Candidatus Paceibacterota bacterium]